MRAALVLTVASCALVTAQFTVAGPCSVCVDVLEKTKRGSYYLLPTICEDLLSTTKDDALYNNCNQVVASFSRFRDDIRLWWHTGCYKNEPYNAMSRITPCPSHSICSQLRNHEGLAFCLPPPTDFVDESELGAGGSGSGAAAPGGSKAGGGGAPKKVGR